MRTLYYFCDASIHLKLTQKFKHTKKSNKVITSWISQRWAPLPSLKSQGGQLYWASDHVMALALEREPWSEMDWKRVWGIKWNGKSQNNVLPLFRTYNKASTVLSSLNLLSHLYLTTFQVAVSFPCLQMSRLGFAEAKEQDHTAESWWSGIQSQTSLLQSLFLITALYCLLKDDPLGWGREAGIEGRRKGMGWSGRAVHGAGQTGM